MGSTWRLGLTFLSLADNDMHLSSTLDIALQIHAHRHLPNAEVPGGHMVSTRVSISRVDLLLDDALFSTARPVLSGRELLGSFPRQ